MKKLKFIDYLVIIIESTYPLSMLKVWTIDLINLPHGFNLTIFMVLAYIIRFGTQSINLNIVKRSILIKLLFVILVFDILQATLHFDPAGMLSTFLYIINILFLINYFERVSSGENYSDNLSVVLRPYKIYSCYNISVIILSALLIAMGVLNPHNNLIAVNSMTYDNVVNGNMSYYFPGYLSLVTSDYRILSVANIPVLTGLSHEPHVLCFLIFPSFFLFLSNYKKSTAKIIIYVVAILILMISYSTTALFVFSLLVLLDLLWNAFVNRSTSNYLFVLVYLVLLGWFLSSYWSLIEIQLVSKTEIDTGSIDYSGAMLKYVISPSGILGYGNIPRAVGLDIATKDIGLVTCVLDVSFFILLIYYSVRLYLSKDVSYHYIGLACLYFTLHSLKTNIMTFSYPYLVFIIYVLYKTYDKMIQCKMAEHSKLE